MRNAIRLAVLAAILPAGAAGAATLIHAGRLIDGVGDAPRERVTVVVDERAHPRRSTAASPPRRSGDEVVDLSGATVLPGFMDMHVHLTSEHSRTSETRQRQEGRIRPRLRFGRLRRAHAARGLHDRAQPRRPVEHLDRPQARNRRGQGQGPAHLHRRALDRHARRPRGRDQFLRALPHERRSAPRYGLQWRRQLPRGRAPALQGRRRLDQDHRDRRRALDREVRQRPAVHRRGARGRDLDRPRLRHEGRRARARRRGDPARGPERHRLHRARHLPRRRGDPPDEGEGHALRADDLRRPLGLRPGPGPDLLPGDRAAQGARGRAADPADLRQGLESRASRSCSARTAASARTATTARNSATWSRRACR